MSQLHNKPDLIKMKYFVNLSIIFIQTFCHPCQLGLEYTECIPTQKGV